MESGNGNTQRKRMSYNKEILAQLRGTMSLIKMTKHTYQIYRLAMSVYSKSQFLVLFCQQICTCNYEEIRFSKFPQVANYNQIKAWTET